MAQRFVTCYPTPEKAKAHMVCSAFARGCDGIVSDARIGLRDGDAFFYGLVPATRSIWLDAIAKKRDWYYADNAYFDKGRQAYYRVTKNDFQIHEWARPDYDRLERLQIRPRPWRDSGAHIVLCEQSEAFMRLCGYGTGWLDKTIEELRKYSDRPLRIRRWNRDKGKMLATLKADLNGAWALVTHMSAAANEALLAGVPVVVTGNCAARPMASTVLSEIESPRMPDGIMDWAAGLAANQWTVEELENGKCWSDLCAL
jgi:hypothetical protein